MAKVFAQAANFIVRVGSLMILGRLVDPKDFGLVGMATAVIGVLNLFKDFGLSTATVQRDIVTDQQLSTLFWINTFVGVILGIVSLALAPALAIFYHDPRVAWVTAVLAAGFVFNGAGIQHSAILQRQMRFTTLALIDTVSLLVSTAAGISLALLGYGYWALVGMTVVAPAISTLYLWLSVKWIPGKPRRHAEVNSMMRFGGITTLNGLIMYAAYNLEKVLLGRFWGAAALGIYGRAYQLTNIPTDNLNSATAGVVFAALSRLQNEPDRLKRYFLKGYSLVLSLTLPITIACALFAKDLILVVLGPKWTEAVPIFRLLAPTILIFAVINPLGWLLLSLGMVGRSLRIALVIAPLVITGYVVGLPHGPKGVAFAYSAVMLSWAIPHIAWCVHGTLISIRDILRVVFRPLVSGLVAAAFAFGVQSLYGQLFPSLLRLALGGTVLLGTYLFLLLYVMGEKSVYLDLLHALKKHFSESTARSGFRSGEA